MKRVFVSGIAVAGMLGAWLVLAPADKEIERERDTVQDFLARHHAGEPVVAEDVDASHPGNEPAYIDGHGPLDLEQWTPQVAAVEGCNGVMQPDVHGVIDVLEQRYAAGERKAAVLLAAAFSCETFFDRPAFAVERQRYWAGIAANEGLAWGYYFRALIAMNEMLSVYGDVTPQEIRRLRRTWHEALVKHYELTGSPDDLHALASSYAHTYGPIFDADRAREWTRKWAGVADASQLSTVGSKLLGRGWGGFRDSALGAELLMQAGEAGNADAVLNLMEFMASCEGSHPSEGFPDIELLYERASALDGASVRGLMALAAERSRSADSGGAYLALSEAQAVQQAEDPYDASTLEMLARLGEYVRSGGVLRLSNPAAGACDPEPRMPE